MTFASVGYAAFLACVAAAYFILPKKLQNPVLFAASLAFYALSLPRDDFFVPLAVLGLCTLFTYFAARAVGAAQGEARKRRAWAAVAVCVAALALFKYYNGVVPTLLGGPALQALGLPLGMSYYTFASVGYLLDVSHGDVEPETNFVRYAVFVFFFGTITSGPICRAGSLLPQLRRERAFSAQRAADALRRMAVGAFKLVAVANILGLYVNAVFADLRAWHGLTLTAAAAAYAFELYFEFSGYTDIAVGTGLLLGLTLPENFKTPYFSTNFSGLWSRWHISLSSWLQDYLFMPLVWGRWTSHLPLVGKYFTKPPMLSSVAIIFLVSGLWHGNTWLFFFWGVLQAAYRVAEDLLHRWRKPPKRPGPLRLWAKRIAVFLLWSASLVFFRVGFLPGGTVADGFYVLAAQFSGISAAQLWADTLAAVEAGFYAKPVMVYGYLAFTFCVFTAALWMDRYQFRHEKEGHISAALAKLPAVPRWLIYFALVGIVLAAYIMQGGCYSGISMAYGGF